MISKDDMTAPFIKPLSECPEFIDTCASWSYGEWGSQTKGAKLEDIIERYKNVACQTGFRQTWVAVIDGKPAGMISLTDLDHPDRKDLSPWLASLFVHPSFRGNGLAKKLADELEQDAQRRGIKTLYLYTPTAEKLYARWGYQKMEDLRDPTGLLDNVSLMNKQM